MFSAEFDYIILARSQSPLNLFKSFPSALSDLYIMLWLHGSCEQDPVRLLHLRRHIGLSILAHQVEFLLLLLPNGRLGHTLKLPLRDASESECGFPPWSLIHNL